MDEPVDRMACEVRQRVAIGDADVRQAYGLSWMFVCSFAGLLARVSDDAQCHRLCMAARGAFGQDAGVRIDHPAAVL
ncbi:hypothetical protein BLA18112_07018 [Burkholderia lata]|uniref:Uncharacterized protein n=2 Tax=Burkholderia lata (strain ATCC 17760 / DSM 23089 / LMG 22485 / NCIMB 9086 / R18194 / 383) TaxID=482957 RepID=A0A6P3AAP5_BURL3|nr:hypothetical protein BLA18112_07018 [Burkholderia lata]